MDTRDELAALVQQLSDAPIDDPAWDEAIDKLRAFADVVISSSERWPGTIQRPELHAVVERLESAVRSLSLGDRAASLPQVGAAWLALERLAKRLV
jgi:hypothetical protein